MFYSHDILTNQQYGVATIWLVANNSVAVRKVTKKAIQQVNVPKACEKIIDPGAPIALRLQGSLLYGIARVYSHQCEYVLLDAEKIQANLKLFYRSLHADGIDPNAGKAKPNQITLQDDPNFDPMAGMPNITELDQILGDEMEKNLGRPLSVTFLSPGESPPEGIHPGSNNMYRLEPGRYVIPFPARRLPAPDINLPAVAQPPVLEEDLSPLPSLDIDFFAPDDDFLLPLRSQDPFLNLPSSPLGLDRAKVPGRDDKGGGNERGQDSLPPNSHIVQHAEDTAGIVDQENNLTQAAENTPVGMTGTQETAAPQLVTAPARGARRKKTYGFDEETQISRSEYAAYTHNYLQMTASHRSRHPPVQTLAQARSNAWYWLYGIGLGGIGNCTLPGVPHPLADLYSGEGLRQIITAASRGIAADDVAISERRRRSSEDAFGPDDGRRVRAKLDDETGANVPALAGEMEMEMEMGMEPAQPLRDRRSSSLVPWSMHSPAVPSSIIRPSPANARLARSLLPRDHSGNVSILDDAMFDLPSLGPEESPRRGLDLGHYDLSNPVDGADGADDQGDDAMHRFRTFLMERALQSDTITTSGAGLAQHWVTFEASIPPHGHSKAEATQAFFLLLRLANRNQVQVRQDDSTAYGDIHIGPVVPPSHSVPLST